LAFYFLKKINNVESNNNNNLVLVQKVTLSVQVTIKSRNYRKVAFYLFAGVSQFLIVNISNGHSIFFFEKVNVFDGCEK